MKMFCGRHNGWCPTFPDLRNHNDFIPWEGKNSCSAKLRKLSHLLSEWLANTIYHAELVDQVFALIVRSWPFWYGHLWPPWKLSER